MAPISVEKAYIVVDLSRGCRKITSQIEKDWLGEQKTHIRIVRKMFVDEPSRDANGDDREEAANNPADLPIT